MDYTTVTWMPAAQTQLEVLSVLAMMDFLEMGQLASVVIIYLDKGTMNNVEQWFIIFRQCN